MIRALLLSILFTSFCIAQDRIKIEVLPYTVEFDADATPTKIPLSATITFKKNNPPPPPPPPPPPAPTELRAVDFGAKPNDNADDTAAINSALLAAKSQGKSAVRLPDGVCQHNNLIFVDSVALVGSGDASELVATNYLKSSIYLRGTKPRLESMKHRFTTAGVARQSHGDTCSVFIDKAKSFAVVNVTVHGSPSAGILNFGGVGTAIDPCVIRNCRVTATLADGIHNTNGSNFVRVEGCTVRQSNDDGIAVVSYRPNGTPTRNITIINNTVEDVNWGRGIAVAGGEFIEVLDNRINRTTAAAVYLLAEDSWDTFGLKGISVKRNTIDRACYDSAGNRICPTGHPAILIGGRASYPAEDITIDANTIRNPTADGIRIDKNVLRVVLSANLITGVQSHRKLISVDPASASQVTIRP